jgi:glutathione S-transferase
MITVHHLNLSRSHRVLWVLEELGLPYEVKNYERNPKTMLAPPELKAVHPLGKSPVITDGALVLAESGAILEYLVEQYLYWLHYAEGSLMPPLFVKLLFDRIESAPVPFFVKPVTKKIANQGRDSWAYPQLRRNLEWIESELQSRPWFAGDAFSAADIQMSYPLEAAGRRIGLDPYPKTKDILERMKARPAFIRAQERGGKFGIPG